MPAFVVPLALKAEAATIHPMSEPSHTTRLTAMDTSTDRYDTVHIDEESNTCKAGVQWLLEKEHGSGTHPITANNCIEMLICGEEGFSRIAGDLKEARQSVDLVCWGFDPGMELVREAKAWPRGETYGDLLNALATRKESPVKVRLLIWYDFIGGVAQKHMPGYTDSLLGSRTSDEWLATSTAMAGGMYLPQPASRKPVGWQRADHCVQWWRWAMDKKNAHLIEVRVRDGDKAAIERSLGREKSQPDKAASDLIGSEESLLVGHGTHHQKTVLIDYRYQEGAKAVGYVMGLNSITSYWDSREHNFHDARREFEDDKPPGDKTETYERVKKAGGKTDKLTIDPFQDYACRIRGESLRCVDANFQKAWLKAGHGPEKPLPTPAKLASGNLTDPRSRVQIIRTQPEDNDQTIKRTYWHATKYARNYIYMENQYFQYRDWADHLKECRKEYRTWYQKNSPKDPRAQGILHAFIVLPRPEKAQMAPRTYDMVKTLGRSDQMKDIDINGQETGQAVIMEEERKGLVKWEADMAAWRQRGASGAAGHRPALSIGEPPRRPHGSVVGRDAREIAEPSAVELEEMGLKVLIGMLVAYDKGDDATHRPNNPGDKYRQIYIHSKLLLIDDAFFTVGSANLNQRSMAVDSEINLATDDPAQATALRKAIWRMHTKNGEGSDGSPVQIAATFKGWQALMRRNDGLKKAGEPLLSFLTTFRESKFSFVRYA
jgi:phosphatidylserine/phosphatidylglycerophosphate/cardiolipin synthase-like enzyme